METRRWTNPTQPQTLQIAVILLYIDAVFGIIFGQAFYSFFVGVLISFAAATGGFGIANEKRWGYFLSVIVAALGVLPLVFVVVNDGVGSLFSLGLILAMVFPIALFALLLHPMSRDYQRIWFR